MTFDVRTASEYSRCRIRGALGITHVINLDEAMIESKEDESMQDIVKHWPTANEPTQRIPLEEGLNSIAEAHAQGGIVMLCCGDAKSLSPSLAIAYIMSSLNLPHLQALAYVMKQKRDISPHAGAFTQLQELEH